MKYSECMARLGERTASAGIMPGLESVRELAGLLNDPQDAVKVIHIAGTNGKGSTLELTASVLRAAGYRVGTFSSPAVFDPWEIMRVDGQMISKREVSYWLTKLFELEERMENRKPTAFEIQTVMAYAWFRKKNCDFAVVECGMGGLYDATNIETKSEVSCLTKIGIDHVSFLGDTVEKIAENKCGIIRENSFAVANLGLMPKKAREVIEKTCEERHTVLLDQSAVAGKFPYALGMTAAYQKENGALALGIVEALRKSGYDIPEEAVRFAFATCRWPGRFECVCDRPAVFLDGAHNADGAEALRKTLEESGRGGNGKWVMVMGVMRDKDFRDIMTKILPFALALYTVTPDNRRAMPADELAGIASKLYPGLPVRACDSVAQGVRLAMEQARSQPCTGVLCFGSLYYLGEAKKAVGEAIL